MLIRGALFSLGLLALGLSLRPAAADDLHRDAFTNLTIEDGLPSLRTHAIRQDARGFFWFATQGGLVRYDGYDLIVHRRRPDDPNSLPDEYLVDLEIDDDGIVWLAGPSGLLRHDPKTNGFEKLTPEGVHDVHWAKAGDLWAAADHRLYRFDAERGEAIAVWEFPEARAGGFAEDPQGDLWIGFYGEGVSRYRPGDGAVERLSLDESLVPYHLRHDGEFLWISTTSQELIRVTTETGEILRLRHDPDDPGSVGAGQVIRTEAYGDEVWAATSSGVEVLDREGRRSRSYRHDPSNPRGLGNGLAVSVYADRDGMVWIGTGGGISRFHPDRSPFEFYQKSSQGAASGLPDGSILALQEDRSGRLWIAGSAGEIVRMDSARSKAESVARPGSRAGAVIWAMTETRDGSIWFGSDHGVERYDPGREQIEEIPGSVDDPAAFTRATSLREDSRGRLWVGTDEGLRRYDQARRRFVDDHPEIKTRVLKVEESPDGAALWVGTDGDGLYRIHGETSAIERHWRKDPADPRGLTHGIIPDLCFDRAGDLWIATLGGGLLKYLPAADSDSSLGDGFQAFRRAEGLPSDAVGAILEDEAGRLWLTATTHLVRFDPSSGAMRTFGARNGLPSAFPPEAGVRISSGELLFTGGDGFLAVRPEKALVASEAPSVVLTDFRLFNQAVEAGADAPIRQPISEAREVVLRHDQNFFALGFAALDYTDPQSLHYAYRLDGSPDDRWIRTDASRRNAQFTNLPAGSYTFHVKAAHRGGEWGSEAQIQVRILPAPWRTWWAYALYALTALGAAAASIRQAYKKWTYERQMNSRLLERDRRLAAANRELAVKNAELTRFTYTLSHDLKNPLHTIQTYASMAAHDVGKGSAERAVEDIDRVLEAGTQMKRMFDELIHVSEIGGAPFRPQQVDLSDVLERALERLGGSFSEVDLQVERPLPNVYGDAWRLAEMYYQLLENAFKFRHPQRLLKLRISARREGDRIVCRVSDNGIGIPERYQEKIFELFHQLDPNVDGTGVGLALVRRILTLHGGMIRVAPKVIGSEIVFDLPRALRQIPDFDSGAEHLPVLMLTQASVASEASC